MAMSVQKKNEPVLSSGNVNGKNYYGELHRKHVIRLVITYLLPLVALIVYFQFQHIALLSESRSLRMRAIAENQALTLDLFMRERLANLSNIIDDPKFRIPPSAATMQEYLEKLKRDSDTFVDIGFFDTDGVQAFYVGPLPDLEKRNYSREPWYITLKENKNRYIITDIYLGLRRQPHFTIGVSRVIDDQYVVLRATLDPKKLYEYITSLEGSGDVYTLVVNRDGCFQVVTPEVGTVIEKSSFVPPQSPWLGTEKVEVSGEKALYAYAWMNTADWAVVVKHAGNGQQNTIFGFQTNIIAVSSIVILAILAVIIIRAKRLVQVEQEKDTAQSQLEHAAKLASVGELSAGIAHEINNPLAIIASETGLMKDLMDPEFSKDATFDDLVPHLKNIREATFRCRDITGKLLSFVRKTNINIQPYDINESIEEIVDGFLVREMASSNIQIIKKFCDNAPRITTDSNQLKQVILNMINNAVDAINPPGRITISTVCNDETFDIAIEDTGIGMTQDQMEKVFLPFYTTKSVGEGTGLGLSVSYGIIKNLGGNIEIESVPGKGSIFTIKLPVS